MQIIDAIRPHLLAHVGVALAPDSPWRAVHAWSEARAEPMATAWESLQLELSNELGVLVQAESVDEYRRWNDIVEVLKAERRDLFDGTRLGERAPEEHRKWVHDAVAWDLILLGTADAYGRLDRVSRCPELLAAYLAGRFPCGTVDDAPDGVLVVL